MSKRVLIKTPILTLDEVVKDLGIGKARRDSIIQIMSAGKTVQRKRISATPILSTSYRKTAKRRAIAKVGTRKKIG